MTLHQIEALAIIAAMLGLFLSDRLRYDVVAGLALCAAALTGVVPRDKVFSGFSNPVIVIIASVLVLGRAIAVSGVIESVVRRVLQRLDSTTLQIGALTAAVTFLSAFIKNVGTLGVFLPLAIQAAERRNRPVSLYLMPLAFGSLVGGTMTLIGTSPNLLISSVRQEITGHPYRLFDFMPVGLPLSVVAAAFLSVGWRLLPRERRGRAMEEKTFRIEDYTSEALLPAGSPLEGRRVADLEALAEGEVSVAAIVRDHESRVIPAGDWTLRAGDVLVLQGDPVALKPVVDEGRLELLGAADVARQAPRDRNDELEAVEAVVMPGSPLAGQSPEQLRLRQRYEVNLLALSRAGGRVTARLRQTRFRPRDIVVLQGRRSRIAETLAALGVRPLAERTLAIARPRPRLAPLLVLAVVLGLIAAQLVTAELGFFIAAVAVVLLGVISPKEAYDAVEWPIVVMLACLIPVGEGLRETGATGLLGDGLALVAAHLPGPLAVGLVLVVSMLVTPALHHAAAVLVMGPVAAAVAKALGYGPDAFLMAVALGAACDFLTPIGHQNNTLVMGPAGYRFGDYWRLGLPLTVMTAVLGTALIVLFWPLRSG
jgi:di/tricarboxylate transporter